MGKNHKYSALREKLVAGTKLAFQRLVKEASLKNDYLIISENGKILRVPARSVKI
jgi:hypothetical protein